MLHVSESRARRKACGRVKCFAQSLADLPAVDASAVRIVDHVALKDPDVTWGLHRSVGARLEHADILPKLMTAPAADDDIVVSVPRYASQKKRRRIGTAHPAWQLAESGAVTLPHVDLDARGVGINTYFIVTRGAELIVAWRREDLHECDALREIPALDALHAIPSLTIVRARKRRRHLHAGRHGAHGDHREDKVSFGISHLPSAWLGKACDAVGRVDEVASEGKLAR